MKKIFFIFILSMMVLDYAQAQSISPTTHANSGGSLYNSGFSIDFTLGNPVVRDMFNNGLILHQGFHFPDCAPRGNGEINGCDFLCAEDSITVYRYKLDSIKNIDATLWSITPATAVSIQNQGSDFIEFKVIDDTITQLMIQVTPLNACGNGLSVIDSVELDTACVVPGDINRDGIVDNDDVMIFGKAIQEMNYDSLFIVPRDLPCSETGLDSTESWGYHPARDVLDIHGNIAAFGDSSGIWLYKHILITDDQYITLQTVPGLESDFAALHKNFGKTEANIGQESIESGIPGASLVQVDDFDSLGNNLLFNINIGDATISHDINLVYFALKFERGIFNRPIMDYDSSHLGNQYHELINGDYFDNTAEDTSIVYVLLGRNDPTTDITFSGDRLCGVICEIPVALNSESENTDSLVNGSFPFKITLQNIIVGDGQGSYTQLSDIEHTFQVEPLPQPKNITAQAQSAHQIDISWQSHIVKPEKFIIEHYSPDTLTLQMSDTILVGDYQSLDTSTNIGTYVYSDNSSYIEPDQLYVYRVRSFNDTIGKSHWSDWAYSLSGPAAPDSLTVTSQGYQNALLFWADRSPYVINTLIEVDSGNTGAFTYVNQSEIQGFTHNGLQPYTDYCYRIRSVNMEGVYSDYSSVECVTTMPAPPQSPQNLYAEGSGTTVELTWNLDTNSIVDKVYVNRIRYSSVGNPQSFNDTINQANTTVYIDTTVERGYYYSYRIYAENASGTSIYSDTSNVLLCHLPNLSMHQYSDTIKLDWADNCKSESTYIIRQTNLITGDTNIISTGYNQDNYDFILPQDTFSYCYELAFHIVDGLYYSHYGHEFCVNGNLTPISSTTNWRAKAINILPNPTKDWVNISHPITTGLTLEVHNIFGQQLLTKTLNNDQTRIDLSRFPIGVYIFNFKTETAIIRTMKVVKSE